MEQKKFVPAPNVEANLKSHRDYQGLMKPVQVKDKNQLIQDKAQELKIDDPFIMSAVMMSQFYGSVQDTKNPMLVEEAFKTAIAKTKG